MPKSSILGSAVVPLRFVFFMWLCFFLEYNYQWNISQYGIQPRTLKGLIGIFLGPLAHGDFYHLVSNTVPLIFLGATLFYFYERIANTIFFRAYFWTNALVWLFARPANHIGASGVVYGLAFFLIFFGIFRRDFISIVISVVTILLYGSIFYGVLPGNPNISWEAHLGGALVGITSAFTFSAKKRVS